MYFEVWLDPLRKHEVLRKLKEVCQEVHEVFYDYDCIVRVDSEEFLKINGVKKYRKHYDC
jgi:hypothetical protein